MTYFVGIDIAKNTHVASVISHQGEIIANPFSFDNNFKGFELLLSNISSLNINDVVIAFESTGHYHCNLFNFLTNHGYLCQLINPLITSKFRKLNIRDVKNDRFDSLSIANYLLFTYSNETKSHEFIINELKELCMEREDLKLQITRLYIKLTAALDQVFPELKAFFRGNLKINAAHNLLKEFPTAFEITKVRIDKLTNVLSLNSKGYRQDKALKLKELAKHSVGYHSSSISQHIKHMIYQIELLESQIEEVTQEITLNVDPISQPLKQIPGLSDVTIAYILSTISSIDKFSSSDKILAFAGLDPKIRQSGNFKATSTRMSKRGNKLLRYALIWGAYNLTKNSKTMKEYYLKKRSEGKSHYNALGHCSKKLVKYIFYILTYPDKSFVLE